MRKSIEERFHEKYQINEETGCWEWTGCLGKTGGYGKFSVKTSRPELAHRVSWKIHYGEIPEGMYVCHKCDNPRCVNPGHLFVGAPKDNSQDCVSKGRHFSPALKGESHGRSVLTKHEVVLIRRALERKGQRGYAAFLSRWFGVSKTTINGIKTGKLWTHI